MIQIRKNCFETNSSSMHSLDSSYYTIESIQFVLPEIKADLLPHIAVDVKEY